MQPLIDGQTRQRARTVRIGQIEDHQTTGTTGDITQVGERTADETSWITLAMPGIWLIQVPEMTGRSGSERSTTVRPRLAEWAR